MSKIKLDKDKEFWQYNKIMFESWVIHKNFGEIFKGKPNMGYEDNMPYGAGEERIYVAGS
jgi:hypothetical protein